MRFLEDERIHSLIQGVLLVLLVFNVFLHIFALSSFSKKEETTDEISTFVEEEEQDTELPYEELEEKQMIKVDIKGAIQKPGVYELSSGSIINDVIHLAGGLKSNASTKYLNLSKKLSDEMVIYIYTTTQVNKMDSPSTDVCTVSSSDIRPCAGSSVVVSGSSTTNSDDNTTDTSGKISINKASLEELMTLSGIGKAKAEAIIQYRQENGGFKTLEEIMKVSGIGEAAYNKIKDNITL